MGGNNTCIASHSFGGSNNDIFDAPTHPSEGETAKRRRVADTNSPSPSHKTRTSPSLPTELVYNISALALGDYLSHLFIRPDDCTRVWGTQNAFSSLLHVNSSFRACTLKLMGYLWENELLNSQTGMLENFRPILIHLHTLSSLAHNDPSSLIIDPIHPVLRERAIRRPLTRFVTLAKDLLMQTAKVNNCLDTDSPGLEFDEIARFFMQPLDVKGLVPAGPSRHLSNAIQAYNIERSYIWLKICGLRGSVRSMNYFRSRIFHRLKTNIRNPDPEVELSRDERFQIIRESLPQRIRCKNLTVDVRSKCLRLLEVSEHKMVMPTVDELEKIGFFEIVKMLSSILKDDVGAPHLGDTDAWPSEGSALWRMAKYCMLELESVMTEKECETYVKPCFGSEYKWFDVKSIIDEGAMKEFSRREDRSGEADGTTDPNN